MGGVGRDRAGQVGGAACATDEDLGARLGRLTDVGRRLLRGTMGLQNAHIHAEPQPATGLGGWLHDFEVGLRTHQNRDVASQFATLVRPLSPMSLR